MLCYTSVPLGTGCGRLVIPRRVRKPGYLGILESLEPELLGHAGESVLPAESWLQRSSGQSLGIVMDDHGGLS